jgi:hypothetical protein
VIAASNTLRSSSTASLIIGAALLLGSLPAAALDQQSNGTAPSTSQPCEKAAARQFDFWLGEWDVYEANGKKAGENRISKILGGCAIQENWSGTDGTTGTSLNSYVVDQKNWHQTWVDNSGSLLQLDGELRDGKMVLAGVAPSRDKPGHMTRHRITWEPMARGNVRQLWEASEDGGNAWRTVFDGTYVRKKYAAPINHSRASCGLPGFSCRAVY